MNPKGPAQRFVLFFILVAVILLTNNNNNNNNGCNQCFTNAALQDDLGTAFHHRRQLSSTLVAVANLSGGSSTVKSTVSSFRQVLYESRRHLVAAAAARAISIFIMYPVDTIKTRMQLRLPIDSLTLFRGVQGSLIGQVPYGVLTFGSYEMYKGYLIQKFPSSSNNKVVLFALAAILGDVTGSGWLCPSEVVKQQLQGGMYASTMDAVRGIWNKNGVAGFYQGYFGGLARDVPFRVAQLTSYEVTKSIYLRAKAKNLKQQHDHNISLLLLSPIESAICGAVAGTFSAAVTAPLDRIKTLLMTEGGGSVLACARKIVADEGVNGLFAGIVPRVAYIAPSVVIFFTVYEQVQQRYLISQQ